jgi:hypothetical protein
MTAFARALHQLLRDFVAEVTAIAHRAARTSLERALDAAPRRAATEKRSPGRPPGRRAAKRTAAELDALAERFLACIQTHPGLRIEQIQRVLGTSTRDLALPVRKLVTSGAIRAEGHKRATTYYPAAAPSVH